MSLNLSQAGGKSPSHADYVVTLTLPLKAKTNYDYIGQPYDKLDPILERYMDRHQCNGLLKSCYCEPTFVVGKNVPLSEGNTFGQCGIEDGDRLHLLFHCDRTLIVSISDVTRNETVRNLAVPVSMPISYLKMLIYQRASKHKWRSRIPCNLLVLKNYKMLELVQETRTLADYYIQQRESLYLDVPTYDVQYYVPEFTIIERALFEPHSTVGKFFINLKKMLPCFEGPLRGAVKNGRGAHSYVYIDPGGKKLYTIETDEDIYYSYNLENHHTITDLYKMIDGCWDYPFEYRSRFNIDMIPGDSSVVPDFAFDHTWARAFMPQMEAESTLIYDYKAIRLFYFKDSYKCVKFEYVYSSMSFCAVRNDICRKEGVSAVNRVLVLYEAKKNKLTPLNDNETLLQRQELVKSDDGYIVLCRTINEKKTILAPTMNVFVKWLTRIHHPAVNLVVRENETISGLKDQIEDIIKVPWAMQKLEFSGKLLEGNGRLKDIGITNNSLLELILPRNIGAHWSSSPTQP